MAVTVAVTEGFVVKILKISEHSSLTVIAEDHNIPYHTLMALQRNNKARQHTLVLGRFCSTTESSRLPCWEEDQNRQQDAGASFTHVKAPLSCTLRCSPLCAQQLQARRQRPYYVARAPRPAEALFPAYTACQTASCSPDKEFALRLYWGRQRGIAVIFATDAMEHAQRVKERYFLGESETMRAALESQSAENIPAHAACVITATPLQKVPYDSESPQGPQSAHSKTQARLFCGKLVIPDDLCSMDGPSTPDNEEADQVCMPAAKRQRLDESPLSAVSTAVARALYLL